MGIRRVLCATNFFFSLSFSPCWSFVCSPNDHILFQYTLAVLGYIFSCWLCFFSFLRYSASCLCLLLLPAALCVMPSYVLFRRLSGAEVYSITVVLTTNARPGIVATNTCSKYTQWQNRAGCERDNRTENKYHFPKVTN